MENAVRRITSKEFSSFNPNLPQDIEKLDQYNREHASAADGSVSEVKTQSENGASDKLLEILNKPVSIETRQKLTEDIFDLLLCANAKLQAPDKVARPAYRPSIMDALDLLELFESDINAAAQEDMSAIDALKKQISACVAEKGETRKQMLRNLASQEKEKWLKYSYEMEEYKTYKELEDKFQRQKKIREEGGQLFGGDKLWKCVGFSSETYVVEGECRYYSPSFGGCDCYRHDGHCDRPKEYCEYDWRMVYTCAWMCVRDMSKPATWDAKSKKLIIPMCLDDVGFTITLQQQ